MKKEYMLEEFLGEDVQESFEDEVDKKISLLYDFCILKRKDEREPLVRQMLLTCQNRTQLDNLVHDIITGKCTLNAMLKRKGFLN